MAVYKARIGIHDSGQLGDADFSFNIHVIGSTTANAWAKAENVAAALLGTVLTEAMTVTSIGVSNSDVVNGTLIIPQNSPGTRATTGAVLPSWNCAQIKLSANLGERIHTFYLRMGLTEDDVAGQLLTVAGTLSDLIDALLAVGACCDKDGQLFGYGSHDAYVHMRQPSWRRRSRPGYKRGWVPV